MMEAEPRIDEGFEDRPRPFDREGVLGRVAPFAGAAVLAFALVPLDSRNERPGYMLAAALVGAAIVAAAILVPWHRLRAGWQVLPPLAYFPVIALLRHGEGGGLSGYSPLVLLPLLWLALYGTRRELIYGVIGVTGTFLIPVLLNDPNYGSSELRRALLWLMVSVIAGTVVQDLLNRLRRTAQLAHSQAASLEQAQSALDAGFKGATIGIAEITPDGRFLEVNDELCSILGRTREGLLRATVFDVTHPDDVEASKADFESALSDDSGSFQSERRYLRPEGQIAWTIFNSTLIRDPDGEADSFFVQVQDITDRKVVENRLVAATSILQSVGAAQREISAAEDPRSETCGAALRLADAHLAVLLEPFGGDHLTATAQAGFELGPIQIRVGKEPSGASVAYTSGKRFFAKDAVGHPAVSQRLVEMAGVKSVLFEPVLRADGSVAGVLAIGWADPVEEEELDAITAIGLLAHDIASVMDRHDLLVQLELLARTDPLTGLPNRRVFDEELERELARAARSGLPLCLAVLDLDHFKVFNDEHGHQQGDVLLKEAAAAWRAALRTTDLIARYGGEEFFVLLPESPLDEASAVIDRLRTFDIHGQTFSAGIARWDGSESNAALVARADHALYQAKKAGRNRIIVA